jgi:pyridoxal phosphate enzyme (YggS family)
MSIADEIVRLHAELPPDVHIVAVSKYHPVEDVLEAYHAGQRAFGENLVPEIVNKCPQLPRDIEWHFIGHLQTNKVKYIAPFIHTVQSVDSLRLLDELNKQAEKNKRQIRILLQVHIAQEANKFGFRFDEIRDFFEWHRPDEWPELIFCGLMGMATFTKDAQQVRREFTALHDCFVDIKHRYFAENPDFIELSMGMSSDYRMAIEEGSNMVRIGSRIFGNRKKTIK